VLTGSDRGPEPDFTPRWRVTLSSEVAILSAARRRLARWAHTSGLSSAIADDLVLAAYEALANSAQHAYQDGVGDIQLTAERTDDQVIITITDHGQWPPTSTADNQGQGLRLMRELADDFRLSPNKDTPGTTVRLCWHLGERTPDPGLLLAGWNH
jgi:serine/threonine-protein kinase RsbW